MIFRLSIQIYWSSNHINVDKIKTNISIIIGLIIIITVIGVLVFPLTEALGFISGLSTLITAIFILWTINEMYEQRKATYQPKIVIPEFIHFHVSWDKKDGDTCLFRQILL